MALAAGRRNVELGDRRLGVGARHDVVRAVAVGTNRGIFRSARYRFAMHALFVGGERSGTDSAAGHHQLLAVAGAAGRGNVDVRDLRLGIAGRQDLVHVAVAVLALGHVGVAGCGSLGVDAVLVRCLLIGMASRADRLGWRRIVWKSLDVGVTIHASERTVDGSLELGVVHMQADLLPVLVFCQSRVAMTGQTIFVAHLWRLWPRPWERPKPSPGATKQVQQSNRYASRKSLHFQPIKPPRAWFFSPLAAT